MNCFEIRGYERYGYVQEGFKIHSGGLKGSYGGMPKSAKTLSKGVLGNH